MISRPVGPLPPAVYWRRRVVLLLVVLAALFVLGRVFGGGAAAEQAADPPPGTETDPFADLLLSPSPTDRSAMPTVRASPSVSVLPSASPSRTVVTACRPAAVQVTVRTDARSYASETRPKFMLEFGNVSRSACRYDVGPKALELIVNSGGDRIWSSDDCNSSTQSRIATLAPGKRRGVAVVWARDRSAPGCPDDRPNARPGTYVVTARVGAARSPGAVFVLR